MPYGWSRPEGTTASIRNCRVSATAHENLRKMELKRRDAQPIGRTSERQPYQFECCKD
jgi:hypothetical protein